MQDLLKSRLREATEASGKALTITQDALFAETGNEATEKEQVLERIRKRLGEIFGERLLSEKNDLNFQLQLREVIRQLLSREEIHDSTLKREALAEQIFVDILGYGPIQQLLEDETITEIMVTRYDKIYIEKGGKMVLQPDIRFDNERHLVSTIEKILNPLGRKITSLEPMVDARLPDGSRVNATLKDVTPDGATLTIRKFTKYKLKGEDYLRWGSLSQEMLDFLKAAVEAETNIIVSGGTGSGKTTLLNMLSNFIPSHLSIVTIEDSLELQLQQDNVRRMEARRAGANGEGEITIRDCVKNSLRMRPDAIVVGEIRSGEVVDMFRAITSGHFGLSTIHAESPRDLVDTVIPILFGMSDMTFTEMAQKKLITSAIPIIVQIARLQDGSRKITNITYVAGVGKEAAKELGIEKGEPNQIYLMDIFRFVQTGVVGGKVQGYFEATGFVPEKLLDRFAARGIYLPREMFLKTKEKTKEGEGVV